MEVQNRRSVAISVQYTTGEREESSSRSRDLPLNANLKFIYIERLNMTLLICLM